LNKSVTIAAEERGTNDIFVPVCITVCYTWNSAPIDGIDIIRLIPAIGRELRFLIDINLNTFPEMIRNNGQAVLYYLKCIDSSRHFSSVILKMRIEDCPTAHTKRINNTRNLIALKLGDIVMDRISIQSNKRREKVAKLVYTVRGLYQIIRTTCHDNYFMMKLHRHDYPELKFMACDLYPLTPSLKIYELVESIDTRYLNQSHAPLINPLKNTLHIEIYNDK